MGPLLSTSQLERLCTGLLTEDPKLIQGATTSPPPLQCVQNWPVEAACLIGYGYAFEDEERTVRDTEEFFAKVCFDADQAMEEPAAVRFLLNWFDETPRVEMIAQLLSEVLRELEWRQVAEVA